MKSLFNTEDFSEIKNRINSIDDNSKAEWGKMNSGQMLKHCQAPFNVVNGTIEFKTKVGFLKKMVFKMMKPIMYNEKPWKHNIPTAREFIINTTVDLNTEKENLAQLVDSFHERKEQKEWLPHPIFGNFTTEQWGKMQYKHLDHHLRQFGV